MEFFLALIGFLAIGTGLMLMIWAIITNVIAWFVLGIVCIALGIVLFILVADF